MPRKSTYYREEHFSPGLVTVKGSFVCKSEEAPSTVNGAGFTVSAPAAAIYTITGRGGPYSGVVYARCGLRDKLSSSSKTCLFSEIVATTDPWTATIVTQSSAGTAATLSGPVVDFEISFRNTAATK